MTRRHYGIITTSVLVLSTAATIGCSEPAKPQAKAVESKPIAPPRPAEEEEFGGVPKPVASGPVSFADADAAYRARNYAVAEEMFTRYTEQSPKNAWGHFMLGLSAWKTGDLLRAEMAFEQALVIDPKHVKSLVNLSRVLLDGNRPEEAVVKLVAVGELDPMSKDVPRLLGRAYTAQGKTDEAIAAYRHAIELDEKDCWAMNNLGLIFFERGSVEDALPLFADAVRLDKTIAAFQNNLGMALEHTGRFSAAAEAYRGALTADPGYEKAKQNLARVEKVKEDPKIEPFDLTGTTVGVVEQGVTEHAGTPASQEDK